ncbi:876_t:CDS:2 [Ambispora leptoticha]|uniref:876_t:CDS:1 n=1 Tax=Ambispora leptoticha TaxID=144679 RepID=A0A9N8ZAF7_9GLOM|nr:876_t:CDS:2 [Ambispora leptoticha]
MQELYKKVNNFILTFTLKKNEKGEPFGSIGFKEISQELEKAGIHLEKSHLMDFHSLNKLGENQEIITLRGRLKMGVASGTSINGDDFYRVPLQVTETEKNGQKIDNQSQSVISNLKENQTITVHGNVGGRDNGLLRVVEFETGDSEEDLFI